MRNSNSLKGNNGKVRVMYLQTDKEKKQTSTHRPIVNCKNSHQRYEIHSPWKNPGERIHTSAYIDRLSSLGKGKVLHSEQQDTPASVDSTKRLLRNETSNLSWKAFCVEDDSSRYHRYRGISGKSKIDPKQLRHQRSKETRVYGENACRALFRNRPGAIVRAWFEKSITPKFSDTLRWMASNRKAYHVVEDYELTKVSGTEHHGGVCFLIKKRTSVSIDNYIASVTTKQCNCVIALEQINNPHNLGAILRSCAQFGVNGVMMSDNALLESGAAVRTAEGGAEHVEAIQCNNILQEMRIFKKAGYSIIILTNKGGMPISKVEMPALAVLVLSEANSLFSQEVLSQADIAVAINGTGLVPSLNVSVSAGILLAEWWRQNRG